MTTNLITKLTQFDKTMIDQGTCSNAHSTLVFQKTLNKFLALENLCSCKSQNQKEEQINLWNELFKIFKIQLYANNLLQTCMQRESNNHFVIHKKIQEAQKLLEQDSNCRKQIQIDAEQLKTHLHNLELYQCTLIERLDSLSKTTKEQSIKIEQQNFNTENLLKKCQNLHVQLEGAQKDFLRVTLEKQSIEKECSNFTRIIMDREALLRQKQLELIDANAALQKVSQKLENFKLSAISNTAVESLQNNKTVNSNSLDEGNTDLLEAGKSHNNIVSNSDDTLQQKYQKMTFVDRMHQVQIKQSESEILILNDINSKKERLCESYIAQIKKSEFERYQAIHAVSEMQSRLDALQQLNHQLCIMQEIDCEYIRKLEKDCQYYLSTHAVVEAATPKPTCVINNLLLKSEDYKTGLNNFSSVLHDIDERVVEAKKIENIENEMPCTFKNICEFMKHQSEATELEVKRLQHPIPEKLYNCPHDELEVFEFEIKEKLSENFLKLSNTEQDRCNTITITSKEISTQTQNAIVITDEALLLQQHINPKQDESPAFKMKNMLTQFIPNTKSIHRWRVLKKSDPSYFDMILKVQQLQRKLLACEEQISKQKDELNQKEQEIAQIQDELKSDRIPSEFYQKLTAYQQKSIKQTSEIRSLRSQIHSANSVK